LSVVLVLVLLCVLLPFGRLAYKRRVHTWLPGLLKSYFQRPGLDKRPVHLMFCFVDHFEPKWGGADYETERARVRKWCERYPQVCDGHEDSDGMPPRHTFFFPEEEYRHEHLQDLAELCRAGYGEIEIHLHHDNDSADGLRQKLRRFVNVLSDEFGAIPRCAETGRLQWAFIHGNWALDNSRPDGRWCGVNDELTVLAEEGCYADFTLPSAPDATQTRTVNSIYYALDDPERPKSHDSGVPVRVNGEASGDLMIIQGPLGLNWSWRKFGVLPRIENSDIRKNCPPRPDRTDIWVRSAIHVKGRPDWLFVKIHTHGTQEADIDTLLGDPVSAMFDDLEKRYNDGTSFALHYVTARELYNIVKAAEAGETGNPGQYRNYVVPPADFGRSRGGSGQ